MATEVKVVGRCPMGCGETLFVGSGGHITCSFVECPNPTAAGEIISPEAIEQRQQEDTERTMLLERLGKQNAELERQVAVLLSQLDGAWWLKAAGAYNRLDELVNGPGEADRST